MACIYVLLSVKCQLLGACISPEVVNKEEENEYKKKKRVICSLVAFRY